MDTYELDYYGFSNEDGDGCMAVFVDYPDIKGVGDTYEEAKVDAYEQLQMYFKKIENQGEKMQERFEKAVEAYENKHFEQAYTLFEQDAEVNTKAMMNLAMMHLKGMGCERSESKAQSYLQRAADKGDSQACYSLAVMYEKGINIDADAETALKYYKGAADTGHVEGQLKTGMLYRQKGNIKEAMRYLVTAAHNNNEQAQGIITYVSNASLAAEINSTFHELDTTRQVALVENMIATKIRPTLEADNGGIDLINYVPGNTPQIWLNYKGACSGCHLGSTSTADMLLDHFETLIDKNVVLYLM